jgi:hypothetical protein
MCLLALPSIAHAGKKRESKGEQKKEYPRLIVGVHGMTGHVTAGEKHEELDGSVLLVDKTGRFLGLGGSADLRIRFWKFVYGNVRFGAFGNVLRESPFHTLLYPAAGIGIYSRLAFLRLEYLHLIPLGAGEYRSAGNEERVRERWKPYAAALTGGVRLPLGTERIKGELTAGMVLGPSRRFSDPLDERDKALSFSFLAGLGLSFDVLK